MSDNSKYRALLDEIAKAIDKYPFGFTYTDLPDQVRQHIAVHADPYSERNQAASAWKAISTHPLIGDLPLLPERGTYADSVRARLDEIAAKAPLPEPDATNPDHYRFAAEILRIYNRRAREDGYTTVTDDTARSASWLDRYAQGVENARSAEREREQRIEQAAEIACNAAAEKIGEGTWNKASDWRRDTFREAARALDAAGLLRGGGRGE